MKKQRIEFSCDTLVKATNPAATVCTPEWLNKMLDDPHVHLIRDNARLLVPKAKEDLPVAFFQGKLAGVRHIGKGAKYSGLVALDVDDHKGVFGLNPESYINEVIMPRINGGELPEACFVYVTPSGSGIRVVALSTQPGKDMLSQQKDLFKKVCPDLPLEALDQSKFKPESAFFLPCRDDVFYLDEDKLFNSEIEMPDDVEMCGENSVKEVSTVTESNGDVAAVVDDIHTKKLDGTDLYLDDIMQALISRYRLFEKKGDRNNNYYALACFMRHLDKDPNDLLRIMPAMGLTLQERQSVIKSALKELTPDAPRPHALQRVIDDMNGVVTDVDDSPKIPSRLPKGMSTILAPFPKEHREAMAIMALTGLAQIGHKGRFVIKRTQQPDYRGDMITFMSFQVGMFASGKSSGVDLVDRLIREHILIDKETERKQMEFNDKQEVAADGQKEIDPHFAYYKLETDTNLPAFNKNMCALQGKPCIITTPEIDDMKKPISFLRDRSVLRKAYDQDVTGQLRSTSKGFSGRAHIHMNLAASGTVGAVMDYFKNVDNGEVSRMLFCSYPNERGKVYVADKRRTATNQKELDDILARLSNWEQPEKPYELKKINAALEEWAENKRMEYNFTGDEALESFRRRCKTQGIKAGAIAFMLEGGTESKAAINFALWVAEYSLYQLLKYFGNKMSESANRDIVLITSRRLKPNDKVFLNLPDEFCNDDVRMQYQSMSMAGTGYRSTISRWIREGFIEPIEGKKGWYRKTQRGLEESNRLLVA